MVVDPSRATGGLSPFLVVPTILATTPKITGATPTSSKLLKVSSKKPRAWLYPRHIALGLSQFC
jgi:hypothetical protein